MNPSLQTIYTPHPSSPFPYCSLFSPSPCSGCVYPQPPLPPSSPGENESRSIAPPEWILLWQAPPLPATAPATEHATLPSARDTPTLSLWLAPKPQTSASLEPHWPKLFSDAVIGWAAGDLVSVGWLPWCPGRSVCTQRSPPIWARLGDSLNIALAASILKLESKLPARSKSLCSHCHLPHRLLL